MPAHPPLPFVFEGDFAEQNFYVTASNERAVSLVQKSVAQQKFALIHGDAGSGKTHLARSLAARLAVSLGDGWSVADFSLAEKVWLVDDFQQLEGQKSLQQVWVHRLNQRHDGGIIVFSQTLPATWPPEQQLPDFLSRMNGLFAHAEILPPDDTLLGKVLHKLASDRQFFLSSTQIEYCLRRIPRQFRACQALIERLDHLSLSQQKKVSRHTLKLALEQFSSPD